MSTKLAERRFSIYVTRRTRFDDVTIARDDWREPDLWTDFRGVILVPADPDFGAGEGEEPDWDMGGYLMEQRTRRRLEGWNFAGRPPEFLIEAWRDGRIMDGVLIATDVVKHRR